MYPEMVLRMTELLPEFCAVESVQLKQKMIRKKNDRRCGIMSVFIMVECVQEYEYHFRGCIPQNYLQIATGALIPG